jgi:hypothetical protein
MDHGDIAPSVCSCRVHPVGLYLQEWVRVEVQEPVLPPENHGNFETTIQTVFSHLRPELTDSPLRPTVTYNTASQIFYPLIDDACCIYYIVQIFLA